MCHTAKEDNNDNDPNDETIRLIANYTVSKVYRNISLQFIPDSHRITSSAISLALQTTSAVVQKILSILLGSSESKYSNFTKHTKNIPKLIVSLGDSQSVQKKRVRKEVY